VTTVYDTASRRVDARSAALNYASRGWPVFPCKPGSKQPATHHGFEDATTEPSLITWWWDRIPDANVAIATGAPAIDVFDVDVKPGGNGYGAFNRLKRAGLLAGALAIVRTPSGGLHAYFQGTAQRSGSLPRQFLDFKATGGYVLAPGSAVDGKPYEFLDRRDGHGRLDWAKAVRLLDPPRPAPVRREWPGGRDVGALAAWLARQQEGNRNSALFWAACRAVETGHDGDLGELLSAALDAGLDEREAQRTVDSARRRIGGHR
jgi:hypothetical protein